MTEPAPALTGVIAYLSVDGADAAAEFYKTPFGAEVLNRMGDDKGRAMHIHLAINGGSIMLSDFFPEHGHPVVAPQAYTLLIPATDANVDAFWERAVTAGCSVVQPLQVMFWGDRYGALKDPYGVSWAMNAPVAKD